MNNHRRNSFDDITRLLDIPLPNGIGDSHHNHQINGFCCTTGGGNGTNSPLFLSLSLDNLISDDYLNLSNINPTIPPVVQTQAQPIVQTHNVNIQNTNEPHLHLSNHHHHDHHHHHLHQQQPQNLNNHYTNNNNIMHKSAFHSFNTQNLIPFIPQQQQLQPMSISPNTYNLLTPTNVSNTTNMKSLFFDSDMGILASK